MTEIYMTPEDFLRAITPGLKQPDGKIFISWRILLGDGFSLLLIDLKLVWNKTINKFDITSNIMLLAC